MQPRFLQGLSFIAFLEARGADQKDLQPIVDLGNTTRQWCGAIDQFTSAIVNGHDAEARKQAVETDRFVALFKKQYGVNVTDIKSSTTLSNEQKQVPLDKLYKINKLLFMRLQAAFDKVTEIENLAESQSGAPQSPALRQEYQMEQDKLRDDMRYQQQQLDALRHLIDRQSIESTY